MQARTRTRSEISAHQSDPYLHFNGEILSAYSDRIIAILFLLRNVSFDSDETVTVINVINQYLCSLMNQSSPQSDGLILEFMRLLSACHISGRITFRATSHVFALLFNLRRTRPADLRICWAVEDIFISSIFQNISGKADAHHLTTATLQCLSDMTEACASSMCAAVFFIFVLVILFRSGVIVFHSYFAAAFAVGQQSFRNIYSIDLRSIHGSISLFYLSAFSPRIRSNPRCVPLTLFLRSW